MYDGSGTSKSDLKINIKNEEAKLLSISLYVPRSTTAETEIDYTGYVTAVKDDGSGDIDKMMCETDIYLEDPLRAIGEYSDVIDFARGKVIRNISEGTVLSEPTEESIDLPEITVPKGDWTLTVKTDTPPSKVEAEYYRW